MTMIPPVSDAVQEVLAKSEDISRRLDALTQTADAPAFESRERDVSAELEAAINEKNEPEIRRLVAQGEELLLQELADRQKHLEEAEAEFDDALKNNAAESSEVSAVSERVKAWRESIEAFQDYISQRKAYYNAEEILEHLNEVVAPTVEAEPFAPSEPESLDERIIRLRAKRAEYLAELKRMDDDLKIRELEASISK